MTKIPDPIDFVQTPEFLCRVEFERYVEQTAANQRRIEEDRLRLQEQLQQVQLYN